MDDPPTGCRLPSVEQGMIYRLGQSGRIPVSKVGIRWRFRQERTDRWLEDMAVSTDALDSRKDERE